MSEEPSAMNHEVKISNRAIHKHAYEQYAAAHRNTVLEGHGPKIHGSG